jgi:Bardet-Biedl syndrome 2 protein
MASLLPSFSFSLNGVIHNNLFSLGHYNPEEKIPSIVYANAPDNLLIHSITNNNNVSNSNSSQQLSVNRSISCLTSGRLNSSSSCDNLFIGSPSNLLCYSVENNSDIFFKDCSDGVNAVVLGPTSSQIANSSSVFNNLVLIGGNCSIQGFNDTGNETFWTVTGDNVSSMTVCAAPGSTADKNSKVSLIVGSEDSQLRIFQGEETVGEITESEIMKHCVGIDANRFAYALGNGEFGVYLIHNQAKAWSEKSKYPVKAVEIYDIDGDGEVELITGLENGRIEARNIQTGALLYKHKLDSAIAKLLVADYRADGNPTIIAASVEGQIKGFLPVSNETQTANSTNLYETQLTDLNKKRNELLAQLKNFEHQLSTGNSSAVESKIKEKGSTTNAANTSSAPNNAGSVGIIPLNTRLSCSLKSSKSNSCLLLALSTNNDTLIKQVILFSDLLYPNGSNCIAPKPNQASSSLEIPIVMEKNVETNIEIRVIVGYRNSASDHVFAFSQRLNRFANFIYLKGRESSGAEFHNISQPKGFVSFYTNERINRVGLWLNAAFNPDSPNSYSPADPTTADNSILSSCISNDSLHATFYHLLGHGLLIIKMVSDNTVNSAGQNHITIKCDSMDIAADLIQDLAVYLKVSHLNCTCDFPDEFSAFQATLQSVEEFNEIRLKLTAEIADSSNVVKSAIIRAEDSRILNHMTNMLHHYHLLSNINSELLNEFLKRSNNHNQLLAALKSVNSIIQRAARLRVGDEKTKLVNACRKYIKLNQPTAIIKIIKLGPEK